MYRFALVLVCMLCPVSFASAQQLTPDLFELISNRDMASLKAAIEAGADINHEKGSGSISLESTERNETIVSGKLSLTPCQSDPMSIISRRASTC